MTRSQHSWFFVRCLIRGVRPGKITKPESPTCRSFNLATPPSSPSEFNIDHSTKENTMFGQKKRRFSAATLGVAAREFERWIAECLEEHAPHRQVVLFNLALHSAAALYQGCKVADEGVVNEIGEELIPNFDGNVQVGVFITDPGESAKYSFLSGGNSDDQSNFVRLVDEGRFDDAIRVQRQGAQTKEVDIRELFWRMIPIRWETITDVNRRSPGGNALLRFLMLLRSPSNSFLSANPEVSAKWHTAAMLLPGQYVAYMKVLQGQLEKATRDFRQGLRA